MHNRSRFRVHVLLVGGFVVSGCSVDTKGITLAVQTDGGPADLVAPAGRDAVTSTGGNPGSGGLLGTGGAIGTGGAVGTGGAIGTGGSGTGGVGGRGGGVGGRVGAGGRGGGAGTAGGCNAVTCPNGCCNGTTCVTNRTNQRCGTAGIACAPCAACTQCSAAGACALTPASRWDVVCSSASIAPTMANGGPWDNGMGGLPDPFCQFTLNGIAQVATATITNTLTPVWDETISPGNLNVTANFLTSQRWGIGVVDDDGGMQVDTPICAVAPDLTAADFTAGTVVFPAAQGCLSLTIQLVCAE
jgi:hypothetical protein